MNRDYLPPTLKSLSQSPPNAATFGLGLAMAGSGAPHSLPLSIAGGVGGGGGGVGVGGGGSSSVPLVVAPTTAANNRRAYRAAHCKLPTVQEGGKWSTSMKAARQTKLHESSILEFLLI